MPLEIAHYLRHLATRCSGLSRDTGDAVLSEELVITASNWSRRRSARSRICAGASAPTRKRRRPTSFPSVYDACRIAGFPPALRKPSRMAIARVIEKSRVF